MRDLLNLWAMTVDYNSSIEAVEVRLDMKYARVKSVGYNTWSSPAHYQDPILNYPHREHGDEES